MDRAATPPEDARASELRTILLNPLIQPGHIPIVWLELVLQYVALGQVAEAAEIASEVELPAGRTGSLVREVGHAAITVGQGAPPLALRSGVERLAQGILDFAQTPWPALLGKIERTQQDGNDYGFHDYSITSYTLWQGGLRCLARSEYPNALPLLLQSVDRYALGQMDGDVLWSMYDVVTCLSLLERPEEAQRYYRENLTAHAPGRFARMAERMLEAFDLGEEHAVADVEADMKEGWQGYRDSWYPRIFARVRSAVAERGRSQAGMSAPAPAVSKSEPSVFLCHSSEDKPFVRRLRRALGKRGIDVWLDEERILVGHDFIEQMNKGIAATTFTVVVLSPRFVERGPWAKQEYQSALARQVEESRVVLLPLLLENCDVPPLLRSKKYADFRGAFATGVEELANSILHHDR